MNFLKENWFKLALLFIFLVVIGLAAYYFFIFNPALSVRGSQKGDTPIEYIVSSSTIATSSHTVAASQLLKLSSKSTSNQNPSLDLSQGILQEVMNRIVLVKCYGAGSVVQGSGTVGLIGSVSDPEVMTNFHVPGGAGGINSSCVINMPAPPNYTPGNLYLTQVGAFDTHYPNVDAAILHILKVSPADQTLFQNFPLPFCDESKVQIGDKVTILGYPYIGTAFGESLTVTDGIISGYGHTQYGVIYKTSALIDHGVSGGLAIKNTGACVLGIPTWNASDLSGNLGYIQSWDSIQEGDIFQINSPSSTSGQPQVSNTNSSTTSNTQTQGTNQQTPQQEEIAAENYYNMNKTCAGLYGNEYSYCITYAYNH